MYVHKPSIRAANQVAKAPKVSARVAERLLQPMVEVAAINEYDYAFHAKNLLQKPRLEMP
jgi:Holliday junction resolvasome RuvABC ATP-dependent DNA helicase subunit